LRISRIIRRHGSASTITVTAAEFQRHFGRYQDEALTQPVAITRNGRERVVMISIDEYRRLKRRDREVLWAGELSDADLAAIACTEMDPRHVWRCRQRVRPRPGSISPPNSQNKPPCAKSWPPPVLERRT
jgi:prevent-host-death family protein